MFYPGAFDDGNPRKGGKFDLVDEETQDMESNLAALELAELEAPGKFGVFLEKRRPTKNEGERAWIADAQAKAADLSEKDLLRQRFAAMR